MPVFMWASTSAYLLLEEPSLAELARVIKAGGCIEASFKRGKSEVGMLLD